MQATDPTFTVGTDSLINIQNTGTALNLGDDQMSGMKPLGFDFEFYGSTFDDVNISTFDKIVEVSNEEPNGCCILS